MMQEAGYHLIFSLCIRKQSSIAHCDQEQQLQWSLDPGTERNIPDPVLIPNTATLLCLFPKTGMNIEWVFPTGDILGTTM